jgi:hypothetical protein
MRRDLGCATYVIDAAVEIIGSIRIAVQGGEKAEGKMVGAILRFGHRG